MVTQAWPNDELTSLANRYQSDKGTDCRCAHGYTRVYGQILSNIRNAPLRILEIGLVHGQVQAEQPSVIDDLGCPSLRMWAEFLPQAEIHGLDIVDFTRLSTNRYTIKRADQGSRDDLNRFVSGVNGKFDIIIDDGSHASHHQQVSLATLFKHLADGGLYIIEDLHFQPQDIEVAGITKTREFLYGLAQSRRGMRVAINQLEFGYLAESVQSIQFFDSLSTRWPLSATADAMAVVRKRGNHLWMPTII